VLATSFFCASQAMTAASFLLAILWIILGAAIVMMFIFNFPRRGNVKMD